MLYYNPTPQELPFLIDDILKSPHTLIGGTTGSGKSVLLNSIIYGFLCNYGVNNRLYLIDPKRVELSIFKGLPHVQRYTHDTEQALNILDELIYIINYRYAEMEKIGIRQYNGTHIYCIIDELADILISPQAKIFKLKLQKILQIARACNIHIIACTQAPNRQIIPANLILNFTNRVALRCLSSIESKQICNFSGAEKLPQYGQGYYLSPKNGLQLVQIPFTSDEKMNAMLQAWTNGKMLVNN